MVSIFSIQFLPHDHSRLLFAVWLSYEGTRTEGMGIMHPIRLRKAAHDNHFLLRMERQDALIGVHSIHAGIYDHVQNDDINLMLIHGRQPAALLSSPRMLKFIFTGYHIAVDFIIQGHITFASR